MTQPDDTQIERAMEDGRPRADVRFRAALRAHLAREEPPDPRPPRFWIAVAGALVSGVALLVLAATGIPA